MPRKLKVFRTAVGFCDAYVAAPSRAAALRAWGTDKDLFARGAAEEVIEPELGAEALQKPGEVVYRTRGGLKEQVAALGKLPDRKPRKTAEKPATAKAAPRPAKPATPRPSRAQVDAAEAAIAQHEREQQEADRAMQERERKLAAERTAMESRFAHEMKQLQDKLEAAQKTYRQALDRWDP